MFTIRINIYFQMAASGGKIFNILFVSLWQKWDWTENKCRLYLFFFSKDRYPKFVSSKISEDNNHFRHLPIFSPWQNTFTDSHSQMIFYSQDSRVAFYVILCDSKQLCCDQYFYYLKLYIWENSAIVCPIYWATTSEFWQHCQMFALLKTIRKPLFWG